MKKLVPLHKNKYFKLIFEIFKLLLLVVAIVGVQWTFSYGLAHIIFSFYFETVPTQPAMILATFMTVAFFFAVLVFFVGREIDKT